MDQTRPGMGNWLRNIARMVTATTTNFGLEQLVRGQPYNSGPMNIETKESEGGQIMNFDEETGWPSLEWNRCKGISMLCW